MKKNTAKSSKSPAPATKEKTTAAPKAAPKKPAVKKTTSKPTAVAPVTPVAPVVRVAVEKPVVAAKSVASKPRPTVITAKIDIGFGNALFIRGEGAGLSWDRGLPMANLGHDTWQIELGESVRPAVFKFLVNDLTWSSGEDYSLASGASEVFTPTF